MKNSTMFLMIVSIFLSITNARDYYGSIAINVEKGIVSSAPDYASSKEVEKVVMASCTRRSGGKPCVFATSFSNSCGAVAWSRNKKVAGGGWADSSLKEAEKVALGRCRSKGGNDCKILDSLCTSWETNEVIWW